MSRCRRSRVWRVRRHSTVEPGETVFRLRHDTQRQRIAVGIGGVQCSGNGRPIRLHGGVIHHWCRVAVGPFAPRPAVAGVAADLEAAPELLGPEGTQGAIRQRRGTVQCRGSPSRGRSGTGLRCPRPRRSCRLTQVCPTGCMPWGPPVTVLGDGECGRPCIRRACRHAPVCAGSAGCRWGATSDTRRASSRDRPRTASPRARSTCDTRRRQVRACWDWWQRSGPPAAASVRERQTPSCSGSARCCGWPCRCGSSGRSAHPASPWRPAAPTSLMEP